jgi:ribosomal protein S18 acetylase RimI-like enzyme
VLRTHRKLGIAAKLMRAAHDAMCGVYDAKYCSLHVRVSNAAAIHLYVDILGYDKKDVEKKYYADGEDAHDMRKTFAQLAEEAEKNQDVDVDSTLLQELKLLSVVG